VYKRQFLLGIELAVIELTPSNVPERLFLTVIALWYTISFLYLVWQALWRDFRTQAVLQILTDLAFTTAVVYISGGIDTSFNFLYPLVIIVASILLPRWWAYLTAALSFILFGGMLELSYFQIVRSYSVTRPDPKSLQAVILINLAAYLAIAHLSSTLTMKLRQVDVQLQTKAGALVNLQALHENIIHSMRGGLITTDLEGRITLLNAPGQRLLECRARDVYGKPVADLFADRLPDVESSAVHGEVRAVTALGKQKTFGITVSPLIVPQRGAIGHVYTFGDLTDIRRLEREVRMRDRLAAVGRMAAGIAHEIRNPLSSIAGAVRVLANVAALNDEQQLLVDIVNRESERLNAIISDFLIYSREKNYQFATLDLIALLEDTLTLLEHRPQKSSAPLAIVRRFEVPQAPAVVDGDRMKQVFWNLCDNAVRAMPVGGTLTVSLAPAGDRWRIAFADTGQGLNPLEAEKIFEPFQSHFEGGTGLGLAIVYQILQAHQAGISVHSAPGQGAEFVVEVRRAGTSSQAEPAEAASVAAAAGAPGAQRFSAGRGEGVIHG